MVRTTVIYAPHPDDEFLYLGAYLQIASRRGDRMILVAATDGDASSARPHGWTREELATARALEQTAAWRTLTGSVTIERMGCRDSADPHLASKITEVARRYEREFGPDSEHYAASNNGQGQGPDHDAVALGLRAANVRVARFANRYTSSYGTRYLPLEPNQMLAVAQSYLFAPRSVPGFFSGLRAAGYPSHIVL